MRRVDGYRFILCSVAALIGLSSERTAFAADVPRTRRVLYNIDGDSCLSTKAGVKGPTSLTVDDVKQVIGEVAYDASQVDTVLININAQVMYYPTHAGTLRAALSTNEERAKWSPSEVQLFKNRQAFFDAGVDPYAVMLAEAKRRGREALISFRMNDAHPDDSLRTQFWVDHPECRLGSGLDFGCEAVRDYTAGLIEEAVRRYDGDGLELDFNRFPNFFRGGSPDDRVAKMTSLVKRVRETLDDVGRARGRRLVLAIRVPSNFGRTPPTPESARALGCDVAKWAAQGWLDFISVSEFLYERDDLPIRPWKAVVGTLPVYGSIECMTGQAREQYLSADRYRHAARVRREAGADGVYLFNFFVSREGHAGEPWEPPFEVLHDLVPG